jgi:hypothetical protein
MIHRLFACLPVRTTDEIRSFYILPPTMSDPENAPSFVPPHLDETSILAGSPRGQRVPTLSLVPQQEESDHDSDNELYQLRQVVESPLDSPAEPGVLATYGVTLPPEADRSFYLKISSVVTPATTLVKGKDEILAMKTDKAREECRNCRYKLATKAGKEKEQAVSQTGNTEAVKARLIAWNFKLFEQRQQYGDAELRPLAGGGAFTEAEFARLVEVMVDPSHHQRIQLIFVRAERGELDHSAQDPADEAWKFVETKYNDFETYMSVHQFEDDLDLCTIRESTSLQ